MNNSSLPEHTQAFESPHAFWIMGSLGGSGGKHFAMMVNCEKAANPTINRDLISPIDDFDRVGRLWWHKAAKHDGVACLGRHCIASSPRLKDQGEIGSMRV